MLSLSTCPGSGRLATLCEDWSESHGRRRKRTCVSRFGFCRVVRKLSLTTVAAWFSACRSAGVGGVNWEWGVGGEGVGVKSVGA